MRDLIEYSRRDVIRALTSISCIFIFCTLIELSRLLLQQVMSSTFSLAITTRCYVVINAATFLVAQLRCITTTQYIVVAASSEHAYLQPREQ